MPFWYFFEIPKFAPEVSERSGIVQLKSYLVGEGDSVTAGTPIALVENHWAVLKLKANGTGVLRKAIFEPGTYVKVGDPIAVIGADGDNIPYGKDYVVVEVIEMKKTKRYRK
jgi:pyruvate/2-oxoglutarate dehydrogenase complex dihydrolipoamide acyltransferase (E2) component